jgi:hypothetical protein
MPCYWSLGARRRPSGQHTRRIAELQEGPARGAFLPSSVRYFRSGAPMHLWPDVDTNGDRRAPRGGMAARPDDLRPGDTFDDHGEARVAQVERAAGEQMGGADRREVHADRADGEPLDGTMHNVHGDGVGIGGERFAARLAHQSSYWRRAVGPPGAVAAGAGGVYCGTPGEFFEFGSAAGAVGHAERADGLVCRISDPAGAAGAPAGAGRGLAPRHARMAPSLAAPGSDRDRQSDSGRREIRHATLIKPSVSVRKGRLSDGILWPVLAGA